MGEKRFPKSSILSVEKFIDTYRMGCRNHERFCFILGSGASVDSGIPMGGTLEYYWMKCMMGEGTDIDGTEPMNAADIRELAENLWQEKRLTYKFKEIEKAWEKMKAEGRKTLSSAYYFDLYTLRFYPHYKNGYRYLESLMEKKEPSFGYHPLTRLLTDGQGNNLVITTNFDSLLEDALFLYTDKKPMIINHELLANYIGDYSIQRPIIAKIHRGLFFDPLNDPEGTTGLKGEWEENLKAIFRMYTPVVIGYGGGDHSLMDFLKDDKNRLPNGIYWCYMEKYGLPDENILDLLRKKGGFLVRTDGFDHVMLQMGNRMFKDEISAHGTEMYLNEQNKKRIDRYYSEIEKLQETRKETENTSESTEEFYKEIDEFKKNEQQDLKRREEKHEMTAWDYNTKGNDLFAKKDYAGAIANYSQAIKMDENNAIFYGNRGLSSYRLKQYEIAIEDLSRAVEKNLSYVNAYYTRGNTYRAIKEYTKALEDYGRAIKLDTHYVAAYNSRGNVYYDLKEYDKAMEDYIKAIELDADYVYAYTGLGNCYYMKQQYKEAEDNYTKAIELDKDYKLAYKNRAMAYRKLGKVEEALADENRVKELEEK